MSFLSLTTALVAQGSSGSVPPRQYWGIRFVTGGSFGSGQSEEIQLRANVGDTVGIATGGTAGSTNTTTLPNPGRLFDNQTQTPPVGSSTAISNSNMPQIAFYNFGAGNEKIIREIAVYSAFEDGSSPTRNLIDWDLVTSSDGVNWTTVGEVRNAVFPGGGGYLAAPVVFPP